MRSLRLLAVLSLAPLAVRAANGSLYDASTYQPLGADHRARRVGDLLTVHIYENSSASTSTDTTTERKNNLDAKVGVLGVSRQYGGDVAVDGKFEGGGATQRANRLLATVSVTVREVLPGGELRIAGEQVLTVNEEAQKVTVEGRVRPEDISADNIVVSPRIADARITFLGQGELSARQRRAWWRVFLDFLGF
jgi:flagellar L-ring protein FlgH